ncbi:probable linoleate 9S-lipoxygenase 5 [Cryptomeria japonica]|uniref:probable linoleate 9S-lipoxygenase 5 n=1 Tax=Cryptomeria japonica TaxID=3369 RepID=UPI0027DA9F04|nr:probable linoleate 9S-lipoxygenase 5 [Cryptomeria japonica]
MVDSIIDIAKFGVTPRKGIKLVFFTKLNLNTNRGLSPNININFAFPSHPSSYQPLCQYHDLFKGLFWHSNVLNSLPGERSFRMGYKIKGHIVLQKKNFLDFQDLPASIADDLSELVGKGVSIRLVGSNVDLKSGSGILGEPAFLKNWISIHGLLAGEKAYAIDFNWDSHFGNPVAILVKNSHHSEFYLKSLTLQHEGNSVHFECNSWVYPASKYTAERVFFSNQSYLPVHTPPVLVNLRKQELESLRGNGMGKREESDRIYDYDVYNDLGDPDKNEELSRPVLGGSQKLPYPRRCRTGRPHTKADPATEGRLPLLKFLDIYVPRDERFGQIKLSDFLAYGLKSIVQFLVPQVTSVFDSTPNEFDSFEDIMKLYSDGLKLPENHFLEAVKDFIPLELIKQFLKTEGGEVHKYPIPQVIVADQHAWRKDEEFAREMISGVNPECIELLKSFPPKSKLDPKEYGDQLSSITAADIEKNLDGFTVTQALQKNKLFILDYHDLLMPYLDRINGLETTKTYATRTILYLKEDGTLKPVAIELSLPRSVSKVFTPAEEGAQGALWQLAKAYVAVNDSGVHELITHWLRTHAATEPYIIAANRQLSAMHPVYRLLSPHFLDTMNINALARQILINAGGLLEQSVFSGKYSMELSAVVYKDWRFDQEGLPADLLKRGMAVKDDSMPHGLKLLIEDYPFAVDGLEIWSAIETWVGDYLSIYYNDELVKTDTELQAWWHEIRYVGHGDKKDESWWYKMETVAELQKTLTTIIWLASALHAATNFGQFAYSGYMPNRPAVSRRLIPQEGSQDFTELVNSPDTAFLKTVSNRYQATTGMSVIEILSRHSTDEVYLGQRSSQGWTNDERVLKQFQKFGSTLVDIEKKISERNEDTMLKNRRGPAQVAYTLLYPSTSDFSHGGGMTGRGIPNSVSI